MEFWKMNGGTLTIDVERDSAGHVTDLFLTGPHQHRLQGRDHRRGAGRFFIKYVSNMLYDRR